MSPRPGEVWMADLGLVAKFRPVVIISRPDPDPPRSLVIHVPLTTQDRGTDYEVALPRLRFLQRESVANVQGIGSLPTVRLGRKLGTLPPAALTEMKRAIVWMLELDPATDWPVRRQPPSDFFTSPRVLSCTPLTAASSFLAPDGLPEPPCSFLIAAALGLTRRLS